MWVKYNTLVSKTKYRVRGYRALGNLEQFYINRVDTQMDRQMLKKKILNCSNKSKVTNEL